jgi:hypothetical protein
MEELCRPLEVGVVDGVSLWYPWTQVTHLELPSPLAYWFAVYDVLGSSRWHEAHQRIVFDISGGDTEAGYDRDE